MESDVSVPLTDLSLDDTTDEDDEEPDTDGLGPWNLFEERVRTFARTTVWPGADDDDFTVAVDGDAWLYHRGRLTHKGTQQAYLLHVQHALPITRDRYPVNQAVARLRFVQQHTKIPALDLVKLDEATNNIFNSPYMLFSWPAGGEELELMYGGSEMSLETRCQVAREVGKLYRELLEAQSSVYGRLVLDPEGKEVRVLPFTSMQIQMNEYCLEERLEFPEGDATARLSQPYEPSTTTKPGLVLDTMTALFNKWKTADLARGEPYRFRVELTDKMMAMAKELSDMGYFDNMPACFGFQYTSLPSTVFNKTADDPEFFALTAVTDLETPPNRPIFSRAIWPWELAHLVPAFVACVTPVRLWDWERFLGGYAEDVLNIEKAVQGAYRDVWRPSRRLIKEAFDEAAGPVFRRLAYDPAYALARRLWRFALDGIGNGLWEGECYDMLTLWDWVKTPEDRDLVVRPGEFHEKPIISRIRNLRKQRGLPESPLEWHDGPRPEGYWDHRFPAHYY
ncbi:hypothetical protein MFIFM68171_06708 [Madurella fahalii]|uniref:Uncharacterized protein n=1 Tax=Madurella fahalii TaxID=1157608 RepID=A0ABQ0GFF8_9PEZI